MEFQSDNTKTTFYYSSEERVDFRELIKSLASEFKVRIEMRQISLRQEASRLGGLGSCGRELCCSTWLTDFKNISTSAARYQNLSLNPAKLSGQCGRLKCCLNYELETYIDALRDIPTVDAPLKTKKGTATLQKTDIFKKIMWFGFEKDTNWYPVAIDKVLEIIELNKKDIIPESLEILTPQVERSLEKDTGKLNSDLENLDKKYSEEQKKKKKKKKNKSGSKGPQEGVQAGVTQPSQPQGQAQPQRQQQPQQQRPPKQQQPQQQKTQQGQPQKPQGQQQKPQQPRQQQQRPQQPRQQQQPGPAQLQQGLPQQVPPQQSQSEPKE